MRIEGNQLFLKFLFFLRFTYLFWKGGEEQRERERERENSQQAPCCVSQCGVGSHELGSHDLSWIRELDTQPIDPPRHPKSIFWQSKFKRAPREVCQWRDHSWRLQVKGRVIMLIKETIKATNKKVRLHISQGIERK